MSNRYLSLMMIPIEYELHVQIMNVFYFKLMPLLLNYAPLLNYNNLQGALIISQILRTVSSHQKTEKTVI